MMNEIIWVIMESEDITSRFKGPEKRERLNNLTRTVGRNVAELARKRMSEMIEKGGRYKIGASGTAAQNMEVVETSNAVGQVSMAVVEGDKTVANFAIRSGIQPGQTPSLKDLRMWVAEKGISLYAPTDRKQEVNKYQNVRGYSAVSKKGKTYSVKPYARFNARVGGRRHKAEAALYAIQRALHDEGSFRPGSNWFQRSPYPKGKGRFDYVAWAMKQGNQIQAELDKDLTRELTAYVDWLASGQKPSSNPKIFTNMG